MITPDDEKPTTPKAWADRWKDEFAAAKAGIARFHKAGDKVLKIFLGEAGMKDDRVTDEQLNLFYSNLVTVRAMLYGQLPKAECDRKFADSADDNARVGSEILERMLNQDIQAPGNGFRDILKQAISDRLLPGLGCGRVRYDFASDIELVPATPAILHPDTQEELAPAVEEHSVETISDEWVDTIYTHWKDFLWSPARTHAEIRWKAFRSYMTRGELKKRFKDFARLKDIPMTSKGPLDQGKVSAMDVKKTEPQAEVWEIWSLDGRECFWYVEGFDEILDHMEDPLGLDQFWPDPPPMIANATTSKYMPKSDYAMAQDLYQAIDVLERRIARLTEACKLVGVYDKKQDDIKRLFSEAIENQLVPVDNWAMFAEKGGLESLIEWLPIEAVTNTIAQLTELQDKKIQQLYMLTGLADIIRGGSQQAYTSAEETKAKVTFASVRIQELQEEFANWVANLQNLKAEIICKHFQPDCIKKQSNIMNTPDAQYADAAIAFLKSPDTARFRIKVQPESMATADYAQMKADRTEFMMGFSQLIQSAAPLLEQQPDAMPFLMQILQWCMTGFKGSQQIEGVMDQMIKAAQIKAAQPKEPKIDPKVQAIQAESQAKIEILQQQAAADRDKDAAKQQMEMERAQADHTAYLEGLQEQRALEQQKFENAMELSKAELVVNLAKLSATQQAAVSGEAIKMISTAEQTRMQAEGDTHQMTLDAALDDKQTSNKMAVTEHATDKAKEAATHAAKVQVQSKDKGDGGGSST